MTATTIKPVLAALCLALSPAVAVAQDGPPGIAFAYAPEQGSGMCMGGDPAATIDCARQKCVEESGALPDDCAPVSWCYPAGWSVVVGVMHREGIHWSEYSCGWPSREAAVAAGNVLCDTSYREYIEECVVAAVWDEEGNQTFLDEEQ